MSKELGIEKLPQETGKLVFGLRDMGYDFNTAIADLIDNSIDANASEISVNLFRSLDDKVHFYIMDNGDGMDKERLLNALTYGSNEKYREGNLKSLGAFGLGLKTASTAFCTKITLLSRMQEGQFLQYSYQWMIKQNIELKH